MVFGFVNVFIPLTHLSSAKASQSVTGPAIDREMTTPIELLGEDNLRSTEVNL